MKGAPRRPRVSVGIPVFNGARFLRAALDGVLGQSFRDLEVIVSDNASTDATAEICEAYAAADSRIRFVRQPVNRGSVENLDFVLAQATGDYFMWAAADDLWDPDYVEVLVAFLEEHRSYVGAFGRYATMDEAGRSRVAASRLALEGDTALERIISLARARDDRFFYGLFRREALVRHRLRRWRLAPEFATDCAYPVLYGLVAAGRVKVDLDTRFYYRVWSGSESGGGLPHWATVCIKANHVVRGTTAVWRATGSPATTLLALGPLLFYQLRTLAWYLLGGRRIQRAVRGLSTRSDERRFTLP